MSKKKILLVEDSVITALSIKHFMNMRGIKNIESVLTYKEAVDKIKEEQYDIALLDICLDGRETGIDVAKVLESESPLTKIFFMSAMWDIPGFKQQLDQVVCEDFIKKPFDIHKLYEGLKAYL